MNRRQMLAGLLSVPVGAAVLKELPVPTFKPTPVSTPKYKFNDDPDSGIYMASKDTLRLHPGSLDQSYLEFTHDGADIIMRHSDSTTELRFMGDDVIPKA